MTGSVVTHIRYVAEAVPDFAAARSFYGGIWGLTEIVGESGLSYFAAEGSTEPFVLRVRRAPEKHLDLIAFGVATTRDVDSMADRLARARVRIDRPPAKLDAPGQGYGMRFFDCDGRLVEISADVSPRASRELEPGEAIPEKLSHVVVNTDNIGRAVTFYQEHLGFAVTDWLEDFMCFLRIDEQHHVLAITQGPYCSLNHASFEMRGVDEYMRGTGRLERHGHSPKWGPGRHGPGNNTFSYFADPNGNVAEYTTELERIEDSSTWSPRRWAATPEQSDLWGTGGPFEEYLPYALNDPDKLMWTPSPL